jgi:uncharacterized protein (TIGR01244 family)
MTVRPVTGDFAVASQLRVADLAEVAGPGFRSVIDNRPDAESHEQLRSGTPPALTRASRSCWRMR